MKDDFLVTSPSDPLDEGFEFWGWTEPGDADPPYLLATYRIHNSLACSVWLTIHESGWAVEGISIHPEYRNVAVGPRRHPPHDTADLAAHTSGVAPPLSARLLRQVPIGRIEADLRERMASSYYLTTQRADQIETVRDARRRRKGDLFYARLAQEYVEAIDDARTHQPAQLLSRRRNVPERTIYRWTYEARRRNLLSQTRAGKAGGRLTGKAKQLLERSEDE